MDNKKEVIIAKKWKLTKDKESYRVVCSVTKQDGIQIRNGIAIALNNKSYGMLGTFLMPKSRSDLLKEILNARQLIKKHIKDNYIMNESTSKYLLIKFQKDYADEFDVYGFLACHEKEWLHHLEYAKNYFIEQAKEGYDSVNVCFGTNEEFEYQDIKEYISSYEITEITEEEFNILNKLFPKSSFDKSNFGNCCMV